MPQVHPQLLPSLAIPSKTLLVFLAHSGYSVAKEASGTDKRDSNPLGIDWSPAPDPENGPPISAGALRDPKYLPIQVGAIIAAYGVSLVLVAIILLSLAKKRREQLRAVNDELLYDAPKRLNGTDSPAEESSNSFALAPFGTLLDQETAPSRATFIVPSPTQRSIAPRVGTYSDPAPVYSDTDMAQDQLEELYKHVLEHEDAKQRGISLNSSTTISAAHNHQCASKSSMISALRWNKENLASLNSNATREEKFQSRASSFFSALRQPRKKTMKCVEISSPIMTPQSGSFPRLELQEMRSMPPRDYAPPPPPPIPTNQVPFGAQFNQNSPVISSKASESEPRIDELTAQSRTSILSGTGHSMSQSPTETDPPSATSQTPLVGLPLSPKPGSVFPSLTSSPRPGTSFSRPNAPSAIRTGGSLPLRAYEPAMSSPSTSAHGTKQTVFERRGPLSPTTGRTPMTAGAVPYSPYQPFTPVIPMTPSLVTREDRKRMKKLVPKTPTVEMVRSDEDLW